VEGGNEKEVSVQPDPVEGLKSVCLDNVAHRAGSIEIHLQCFFASLDLAKHFQIFR